MCTSVLSLSSEGQHFFRGQRHAMRRIRGWSLVSYKIIIHSLFSPEIIPSIFPRVQHWEASIWIILIAKHCSYWCPQARLWAVHIYILQFFLMSPSLILPLLFFFYISAISILCNTRVPVLWHPPQTAASQKGLTSTWSSWSFIPPFEEPVGRVKRHPWKSSVLTSRKNSQGFSPMRMRGSLCFVSLIFFPSLMVGHHF